MPRTAWRRVFNTRTRCGHTGLMKRKWSKQTRGCRCAVDRERIVRELRQHISKEIKKEEGQIRDRLKKLDKDIEAIWRGLAEDR